jgi:hypothetical protein
LKKTCDLVFGEKRKRSDIEYNMRTLEKNILFCFGGENKEILVIES